MFLQNYQDSEIVLVENEENEEKEENKGKKEKEDLHKEGGEGGGEELQKPFSKDWWISVSVAMFCTFWGGLMSGLTVGLLSIDELELELKQFTGTD